MRELKFNSVFLAGLASVSLLTTASYSYDGYKHQKTIGSLPDGAPLPDYEIQKNDKITAKCAYVEAQKCLTNHAQIDATAYFERAINALRRDKKRADKELTKKIVLDYGTLLRAHMGANKANDLEKEFLSQ